MNELESSVHVHSKSGWAPHFTPRKTNSVKKFKAELISLYGLEEASVRFVLDPLKIAVYEYDNELIPIDIDPHLDE